MNISRKQLHIGVGALLLVIAIWFVYRSFGSYDIVNRDSEGATIVAFGDSLVQGVGSRDGGDFVSILAHKVGQPILNLGKAGDTTGSALERLPAVIEANPRIVIILLGGNDFIRRVPIDTTFDNLSQMVQTIQSNGAAVIVLGVRGGLLYDSYDGRFKSFAREHGAAFVPNVLDGLLGDTLFMSDAIHPNNLGYSKIADKVWPVLRELLSQR